MGNATYTDIHDENAPLVGYWFVFVEGEKITVGRVLANPEVGFYLVSTGDGLPLCIAQFASMIGWQFFQTEEEAQEWASK